MNKSPLHSEHGRPVPTSKHGGGLFLKLFNGMEIHFQEGKKILSKSESHTLLDIASIKEAVFKDANEFKQLMIKEVAEQKHQAKRQGFDTGLNMLLDKIVAHEKMMQTVHTEMLQLVSNIAFKAAERIVFQTIEERPELIKNIVQAALAKVSDSKKLVLFVNTKDFPMIKADHSQLQGKLKAATTFSIQASINVERGGCIIQTENGVINADIKSVLNKLELFFKKHQERARSAASKMKNILSQERPSDRKKKSKPVKEKEGSPAPSS